MTQPQLLSMLVSLLKIQILVEGLDSPRLDHSPFLNQVFSFMSCYGPQSHQNHVEWEIKSYPMGSCGKKGKDILGRSQLEQPRGINWEIGNDICAVCLVAQSCPAVTAWTVAHQAPLSMGILQARILAWVVILSSRGSSHPRDGTQVSHIKGRFFTV